MSTEEVISIRDFKRLDIRIGTIKQVEPIPSSNKLFRIQMDMGDHNRQIISGIAEYYKCEELVGLQIAVLCNLKPAKIFGNDSNGMLLASESEANLALLTVERKISNGAKVT
jgi:methionyl-tRNA synthetase